MKRTPQGMSVKERVEYGVTVDPVTGCWVWQRGKNLGYGVIKVGNTVRPVHRVAYEAWNGPVPEGLELLHRTGCPRACCNPEHLTPGTHAENMAQYAEQNTHCRRGHAYAEHQTIRADGKRVCIKCRRINAADQRRKHS